MSVATELERGRSFDVLGFLASDALEAVDSTLRSESLRWGTSSAASMTVVCAFRRKGACGRGWKAEGGELAVAAASTLDAGGSCCQTGTVTCHATGHAILSTMSFLDAGELADVFHEFPLSR